MVLLAAACSQTSTRDYRASSRPQRFPGFILLPTLPGSREAPIAGRSIYETLNINEAQIAFSLISHH